MTSPMNIAGIGQIAICVTDLAVARRFYHETLGLEIMMEADQMVFLQAGNLRLMIGTQHDNPAATSSVILYLRTDNIDGDCEYLKSSNIDIIQGPLVAHKDDAHTLYLAFFKDPDGHSLALMEERSNS